VGQLGVGVWFARRQVGFFLSRQSAHRGTDIAIVNSVGGFFGLGAQPAGQGQVYRDIASFINVARGGQAASDSSDDEIVATGAIVGGSVGGAFMALAVAAIVYKRRHSRRETPGSIIMDSPAVVLAVAESPNPRFGIVSFLRKSLRLSSRSEGEHDRSSAMREGATKKTPFPGDEQTAVANSPLHSANPSFGKHAAEDVATDV